MIIGIDGNEANVKNRVGTGIYAYELLKQFHLISLRAARRSNPYSSVIPAKAGIQKNSVGKNKILDQVENDTTPRFIIYLKNPPLPDLPKEAERFQYQVFGPQKLWTQFALPVKLTFGSEIDVLFSMAHYGPRFSKVPYVVTVHDLSYLHFPQMFRKNDLYQLTSWSKYSIRNAAHIIAVSKKTRDDIIKNYNVDPSRITVTYEGYDKERFSPQPKVKVERVKKKYKIDGDYIIFVGTLQPRKNLERLIEAFKILVHSSQFTVHRNIKSVNRQPSTVNLSLVIVGKKGWLYEPIFEKAKDLNLEPKVIFTDYVPDDDLPALISGAQIYVLPSLWEGFGIPVIEAQACGVPVVVANTSSLPEIVGESGILVDPESIDAIASGIKKALDPKSREVLIKKGLENIKRFSWQTCAKETLEALTKVASR